MPRVLRPLPPDGPEFGDALRRLQESEASRPTTTAGDRVRSPRSDKQAFRLGAGNHYTTALRATERVDVTGDGPATCTVATPVAVDAPVVSLFGVRLDKPLTIPNGKTVFLTHCQVTEVVTVEAGGRVHFTACHFSGNGYATNAGVLTNAYITNCYKTSTPAHVNVTVVSEN